MVDRAGRYRALPGDAQRILRVLSVLCEPVGQQTLQKVLDALGWRDSRGLPLAQRMDRALRERLLAQGLIEQTRARSDLSSGPAGAPGPGDGGRRDLRRHRRGCGAGGPDGAAQLLGAAERGAPPAPAAAGPLRGAGGQGPGAARAGPHRLGEPGLLPDRRATGPGLHPLPRSGLDRTARPPAPDPGLRSPAARVGPRPGRRPRDLCRRGAASDTPGRDPPGRRRGAGRAAAAARSPRRGPAAAGRARRPRGPGPARAGCASCRATMPGSIASVEAAELSVRRQTRKRNLYTPGIPGALYLAALLRRGERADFERVQRQVAVCYRAPVYRSNRAGLPCAGRPGRGGGRPAAAGGELLAEGEPCGLRPLSDPVPGPRHRLAWGPACPGTCCRR